MKNLPPLPLVNGALYLDYSHGLDNLLTCMRKTEYNFLHNRIRSDDAVALNFGTAVHMALELRYQRYGTGQVDQAYFDDLSKVLAHYFESHPTPVDDWRNMNWCLELIHHYLGRYPTEDFELLEWREPRKCDHCNSGIVVSTNKTCPFCLGTGLSKRIVEVSFCTKLYDTTYFDPSSDVQHHLPVFYTGKIDLPVHQHGQLFIMDHKTSSWMGDTVWDSLNMSDQQKGYAWAWAETTGQFVSGYMPDVIRSKEPPKYISEEREYKGKKGSIKTWWEESFQRDYHYLGEGELVAWKRNTIAKVEELLWHYTRDYMPMESTACTRFGRCAFYDVCNIFPEKNRLLQLQSPMFKNNVWSPLVNK